MRNCTSVRVNRTKEIELKEISYFLLGIILERV